MNLRQTATIATILVIIAGFAMIAPLFLNQDKAAPKQVVMLSFTISEANDVSNWCQNLSSTLSTYNLPAAIFIEGKVAEQNPQTITCFNNKVDFGSLTYDHVNLNNINDYSLKLWEVEQGKTAIDNAAKTNSTFFKAPNGATDENIFSMLNRSGIKADFSYTDHFNIYRNERFEKIAANIYDTKACTTEYLLTQQITPTPLIIQFDNTQTPQQVESILLELKTGPFQFMNASELIELVQTRGY